jgi:signal transduction histidine kinase
MQALLSSSEKASQQLASLIESGKVKPAASQEGKNKIAHLVKEVDANLDKFTRVSDDKNHPAGRTIRQFLTELKQSERISILDFTNPISEVKTKTNLNELIKDVAALANEDFRKSSPEFEFELLLDLEGILPDIEIYDPELREALFCLISNSMRAVQSRSGSAPKGYKPKVTVSSRKLPRFIQIRIRHNGLETMLEQSDDNVMLSDSMDDNNKILGMQIAKEIITERHKGEIAFETEPGSQTDTIIRFQTYILQ